MFHSGKMTTGTSQLVTTDYLFGLHQSNEKHDNLKFDAIKYVAQNEDKFKKMKIWLTQMALNREKGDPFDCFEGWGLFQDSDFFRRGKLFLLAKNA